MGIRFVGGKVLRNGAFVEEDLWIENGRICERQKNAEEIRVEGQLISPGFIDLQINGALGVDFSLHPELLPEVSAFLPRYGVTSFLPTLISAPQQSYAHVLPILRKQIGTKNGAVALGIHLEGPFLHPLQAGAHPIEALKNFSEVSSLEKFYGGLEGIKIVTLAPELPGAMQAILDLHRKGVVVAAGHTSATMEEMNEAVKNGVSFVTHLFNAMTPFHHREPGVIGAALTDPHLYYSIIADGVHTHPSALFLAWKANPKGSILITDGMSGLGMPKGIYVLGGQEVDVQDGYAVLDGENKLAGSIQGIDAMVRFFHKSTGCSVAEALEAASLKPARLLGLEATKGSLEIGSDADIVVLDEHLFPQATYVQGKKVYSSSSSSMSSS